MKCKYCGRAAPRGYETCGDSFCQEEAYWASKARTMRGKRQREEAMQQMLRCQHERENVL
jgi:predicted nucleic acid-binding Zn ribbon protein